MTPALRAALAAPEPVLRAVGTVELPEPDRVARAFVHGLPYVLYHLARPARLLGEPARAAEPVDS